MTGGLGTNGNLKVLLIEDHPLIVEGCRLAIERRTDIELSVASSAAAGLEANVAVGPDIVILDIALPDKSGLDIIEPLLRANADLQIIILSMHSSSHYVDRALALGVNGYISKDDNSAVILTAIDKISRGETYLGQALAQTVVLDKMSEKLSPIRTLTRRERKILEQIGKGLSLAEVAAEVGLSYKTIANAVTLIKHKLKTPTNAALIKFAVEHADR